MTEKEENAGALALKLLADYREKLFAVAASLTDDRHAQEDLVMRTFERAMAHFGEYDAQKASLTTWLATILKNLRASDVRGKMRQALSYVDPGEVSGDLSPADNGTLNEILAHSDRDELRRAIGQLGKRDREAIVMFYFLDLPIAQIAKILACPVGTIKCRLSRARLALREILEHRVGKGTLMVAALAVMALFSIVTRERVDVVGERVAEARRAVAQTEAAVSSAATVREPSHDVQEMISYAKREGLAVYGERADGCWERTTNDPNDANYCAFRL